MQQRSQEGPPRVWNQIDVMCSGLSSQDFPILSMCLYMILQKIEILSFQPHRYLPRHIESPTVTEIAWFIIRVYNLVAIRSKRRPDGLFAIGHSDDEREREHVGSLRIRRQTCELMHVQTKN